MFFKSVSYPLRGLQWPVTVDNIVFRVMVVVKGATNSVFFFMGRGLVEGNFTSFGEKGSLKAACTT